MQKYKSFHGYFSPIIIVACPNPLTISLETIPSSFSLFTKPLAQRLVSKARPCSLKRGILTCSKYIIFSVASVVLNRPLTVLSAIQSSIMSLNSMPSNSDSKSTSELSHFLFSRLPLFHFGTSHQNVPVTFEQNLRNCLIQILQ